jgi:hypothetical protein
MVKRVRIGGSTAEKSEMPGFIKPQLAVPKSKAPAGLKPADSSGTGKRPENRLGHQ